VQTSRAMSPSTQTPVSSLRRDDDRLDVSGNGTLDGALPWAAIAASRSLRRVLLAENRFAGRIAVDAFDAASALEVLDATHNRLTGRVPARWPATLVELALAHNDLDGPLAPVFFPHDDHRGGACCPRLASLFLDHNRLAGPLPRDLGAACPALTALNLSHNDLVGPAPSVFPRGLRRCDLSGNPGLYDEPRVVSQGVSGVGVAAGLVDVATADPPPSRDLARPRRFRRDALAATVAFERLLAGRPTDSASFDGATAAADKDPYLFVTPLQPRAAAA